MVIGMRLLSIRKHVVSTLVATKKKCKLAKFSVACFRTLKAYTNLRIIFKIVLKSSIIQMSSINLSFMSIFRQIYCGQTSVAARPLTETVVRLQLQLPPCITAVHVYMSG